MRNCPEIIITRNIQGMIRFLGLPGIVRHSTGTDSRFITRWTFR